MVTGLSLDLKCSVHNESFATPTEFYAHEASKPHSHSGETICSDCLTRGIKERVQIDETEKEKGKALGRCNGCYEKLEKKILEKQKKKESK